MKKLIVLATFGLAFGAAHQAVACDFGARAASAAPTVVAMTEAPTATAAKPETAAPKASPTDEPLTPNAAIAYRVIRYECGGVSKRLTAGVEGAHHKALS